MVVCATVVVFATAAAIVIVSLLCDTLTPTYIFSCIELTQAYIATTHYLLDSCNPTCNL
eukprot:m.99739 g.99739  ORF g.99739 m.99739 type:complete len:59 (-) comp13150_c0_seq1:389-565(-)